MNKIEKKLIELEDKGWIDFDISYRGGHYGLSRNDACELLGIEGGFADYLPAKVGVYCNYLGGGLRGAVVDGGYDKNLPTKYAKKVDTYIDACKKRYLAIENGMNDEELPDGEPNWDAIGTNRSRAAGVVSGY